MLPEPLLFTPPVNPLPADTQLARDSFVTAWESAEKKLSDAVTEHDALFDKLNAAAGAAAEALEVKLDHAKAKVRRVRREALSMKILALQTFASTFPQLLRRDQTLGMEDAVQAVTAKQQELLDYLASGGWNMEFPQRYNGTVDAHPEIKKRRDALQAFHEFANRDCYKNFGENLEGNYDRLEAELAGLDQQRRAVPA